MTERTAVGGARRAQKKVEGRTIDDVTPRCCRWPLGDPRSPLFRFCGRKKRVGSPYCDEHHRSAYVKVGQGSKGVGGSRMEEGGSGK